MESLSEFSGSLDFGIARSSWVGNYPDPNTFLDLFLSGGGNNRTGWADPAYDRMIAAAAGEGNPAERFAMLRSAEQYLVRDQVPIAPLFSTSGSSSTTDRNSAASRRMSSTSIRSGRCIGGKNETTLFDPRLYRARHRSHRRTRRRVRSPACTTGPPPHPRGSPPGPSDLSGGITPTGLSLALRRDDSGRSGDSGGTRASRLPHRAIGDPSQSPREQCRPRGSGLLRHSGVGASGADALGECRGPDAPDALAPSDAPGQKSRGRAECQLHRGVLPPARDGRLCRDQGLCHELPAKRFAWSSSLTGSV